MWDNDPGRPAPTFFSLELPAELGRDLDRCSLYCSGALRHQTAQALDALPSRAESTLEEQAERAYGGPIESEKEYPQVRVRPLRGCDGEVLTEWTV